MWNNIQDLKFLIYFRVCKKLGPLKCFNVFLYRVLKKYGFYRFFAKRQICPAPEIKDNKKFLIPKQFNTFWMDSSKKKCLYLSDLLLEGKIKYFSNEFLLVGNPPNWFLDSKNKLIFPDSKYHWSQCSFFSSGDIKCVWELSRWNWTLLLARAWHYTRNEKYLDSLDLLMKSWCDKNPPFYGVNWLCGQECSIRLINAMISWKLIDGLGNKVNKSSNRIRFVSLHLKRISQTINYALAQDNNHGISEAAALFIGGAWLKNKKFENKGRLLLEKLILRLIMDDGSFSQNSLTYHRFLIDTISQVIIWQRFLGLKEFSNHFKKKCLLAINWLFLMTDSISGDGPNLGSNDGTFCYQLHDMPYRDFRPTIQLAYFLFKGKNAYHEGPWDEHVYMMGFSNQSPKLKIKKTHLKLFNEGGFVLINPKDCNWALFRLPKYKFRPSHADPLHVDLWYRGRNILKDGGTFSYNTQKKELFYFSGIESHNTVQFDDFEPMPRLSRFLWGDWLKLKYGPIIEDNKNYTSVCASYISGKSLHNRIVKFDYKKSNWVIIDQLSNFDFKATLRWRLCLSNWLLKDNTISSDLAKIIITSDNKSNIYRLKNGWESLYYGDKKSITVLEIDFLKSPVTVVTTIKLNNSQ